MRNWSLLITLIFAFPSLSLAQNLTRLNIDFDINGIDNTDLEFALAGGMNSPQVSAADLNNDGLEDLFIFDRVGNTIQTFINNGGPGANYSFSPEYVDNFPKLRQWVLLRDYNDDGVVDIFAYSDIPGFHGIIVYDGFINGDNEIAFERFNFDNDANLITVPLLSNPNTDTQIYVTNIDYPAIDDLDCDGDFDILTFNINGGYVEFYKNQSVEMGYGMDSLIFKLEENCWGGFYESGITVEVDLSTVQGECFDNFNSDPIEFRHAGSTLLTYDADNDGDKELVLGDLNFQNLNFLHNGGDCGEAWMDAQDNSFPNFSNPTQIPIFPVAFYLDVNNDGKKDLLTAPSVENNGENKNVLWLYENVGSNEFPEFSFVQNDFLVGEMVDMGTGADPCFVDYNADGLLDLVVGNNSFYAPFGDKDPRLFLFENVGTSTDPSFKLIDQDYLDLNQFGQTIFDFSPEFGDLDSDGDVDVIIGDNEGRIHYAQNIAGPGAPLQFSGWQLLFENIDVGQSSNPEMVDINRDGLMDLIIGERNGNINYYRNLGEVGLPDFISSPTSWPNFQDVGYIDTRIPGTITGNGESSPVVLDFEDGYRLFTGSEDGRLEIYHNLDGTLYDTIEADVTTFGNLNIGTFTTLDLADINDDGFLDMVVGNWRGGLSFYGTDISTGLVSTSEVEPTFNLNISPNPAKNQISIGVNQFDAEEKYLSLYDAAGQLVLERQWNNQAINLNVNKLPKGLYFAKVRIDGAVRVEKVIIQ